MPETPVIAEVVRSGFVESVHRGAVVALDAGRRPVVAIGPVDEPVLLRSAAKPLQAAGMVRAGLTLHGPQLAVACASHDGQPAHLDAVRAILAGAGVDESALDNTPAPALDPMVAAEQQLAGGPDRLHQNCSGKHAAMLATCVANGWRLAGYLDPGHPLQRAIVEAVEDLCGEPVAHVAVDGCGAPIVAVSTAGLARGFSRLAVAEEPLEPVAAVAAAMRAYTALAGGDRRDVTKLMRAVPGLIAKDGAEGVFAVAMPDGRSVAVKVADGASRATVPVVVAALRALGVDAPGLDALAEPPVLGHGEPVGTIRATLDLRSRG